PTYAPILTTDQIRYMLDAIYTTTTIEAQIRSGEQTYLMLRDDTGAQGFASYGRRSDDPKVYKIHKLYVLPDNHKRGYGRALIHHIASRLRDLGATAVDLNVNRYNPARGFYEKIGFQLIREEDIPIGPYWMNDYVFRLAL